MAKQQLQSIHELNKFINKENLLPIYFLCGEDTFTIDLAVEAIEKAVHPLIETDFDKEVFNGEKSLELSQVLDLALAFPFGGGKKFLIIKNFDKVNEKKALSSYIKSPAEFTILVITYPANLPDVSKEPFSLLFQKKYIFEAKPLTGNELINWFVKTCKKQGLDIADDSAQAIIEIVGEDKILLEIQLQKFIAFANGRTQLTNEELIKLSSPTKEYSIFDFIGALGTGNKSRALEIGFKLLESGAEIVYIVNMVAKLILTVAQILDLSRQRVSDNEGAKLAGVSYYYYLNCKKATYFMNDDRLGNASRALLNADLSIKNTSMDSKTVLQILVSEILGQVINSPFDI